MTIELKKRLTTSILLLFGLTMMFASHILLLYFLIIISIGAFVEYSSISKIIFSKRKYIEFLSNITFIIYIFIFSFFFFLASLFHDTKVFIFLCSLICIASDVGGLFFGRIFQGPKLTKLSPKKTISGSIGSFIFSIAINIFLTLYLFPIYSLIKMIILALFISLGCQIGDIFFSYLKRKAKIKDTSNILPGHGGILDRIDGMLLGLPFGVGISILSYYLIT
jgi:phosphatidate cytidylyltransferase